jgi:hypothetical protein
MNSLGFNDWYFKTDTNWADLIPDKLENLLAREGEFCSQVKMKKKEYRKKHEELAEFTIELLSKRK